MEVALILVGAEDIIINMIIGNDPRAGYVAHRDEIDKAIARVMESGRYLCGEELVSFEEEFARYIGVKYAVGVGSGTEALRAALVGLGIGNGDEVITVSFTCTPTIAAIEQAGARPVVIDIESKYYTLDPKLIEAAITTKTKAILPVHLYGQSAEMDAIGDIADKHDLVVVEDACQAHGAEYLGRKVGSIGEVGCFSFYPTKNLGSFGDGGMVVTDDARVARKVRLFREYGWETQYNSVMRGWNSRLSELQAAVLRVKLKYLEHDNAMRVKIAERYSKSLMARGLGLPEQRDKAKHVWHQYVVRASKRNLLLKRLRHEGVAASVHYPIPVHLQAVYKNSLKVSGELGHTERVAEQVLSIPIYAQLTMEQLDHVEGVINNLTNEAVRA